jgi:hypothetical protein
LLDPPRSRGDACERDDGAADRRREGHYIHATDRK